MLGFILGLILGILATLYCARADYRQKTNTWLVTKFDKLMNPPKKKKASKSVRVVKAKGVR